MKKILLSIAALTMLFGVTLFTSCSKDDTTPPVITLGGANPYTVTLGATYTDPAGTTATDNKDGDLTASIVNNIVSGANPNMNLAGNYTITYTVSDAAGNTGTASRTVIVANSAAFLGGSYNVTDIGTGSASGTWNYVVTVTASSTVNNNISIANFGGFGTSVVVVASLSGGTNLNIANQTPTGINYAIQGTGLTNTTSILSTTTVADSSTYTENDACSYIRSAKK